MFDVLRKWRPVFFLEADTGKSGGTTETSSGAAAEPGKTDSKSEAEPAKAKAGSDGKEKKPAVQWTDEQQAEIDLIMGRTRQEERKKARADFDADVAKAKKDAEEKELQEKQEFKTLAEKRQGDIETLKKEVETLTAAKEQGEKYRTALEKSLQAQTEKLPKHIKTLLAKMDVLEQMEYLTENGKDLGVKLESIEPTLKDNNQPSSDFEAKQSKDMKSFVRSIT